MWVCAVLPKGFEPWNPICLSLLFSWVIGDGAAEVTQVWEAGLLLPL